MPQENETFGIVPTSKSDAANIRAMVKGFENLVTIGDKFDVTQRGIEAHFKAQHAQIRILQDDLKRMDASAQHAQRSLNRVSEGARKAFGWLFGGGGAGNKSLFAFENVAKLAAVGAATATAKSLAGWFTSNAWQRAYSQALGGAFRNVNDLLPDVRTSELFSGFAEQGLSRRFAGATEIEGLKNLRDTLEKSLGSERGQSLALELTASFGESNAELSKFLAMASGPNGVERALRAFESQKIDSFATALSAVSMKENEVSKTALTIDQVYRDIKKSFEDFAVSVVEKHGGSVREMIDSIGKTTMGLVSAAQATIAEWQPVIDYIRDGLKSIAKLSQEGRLIGGIDVARDKFDPLGTGAGTSVWSESALQAWNDRQNAAAVAKLQALKKPADELPPVIKAAADRMAEVVAQTNAEKAAIERVLTPAERMAKALSDLQTPREFQEAMLELRRSEVAANEANPLGFGDAYAAKLDMVKEINRTLDVITEQIRNTDQSTHKGQIAAIALETKRNQLIAERSALLADQARGYLDAVQAQAFGAGRFEKIIVSQEQNIAAALQAGIAKANPLLGQAGSHATGLVSPFTWGAGDPMEYQRQLRESFGPGGPMQAGLLPPSPYQDVLIDRASNPSPRRSSKSTSALDSAASDLRGIAKLAESAADKLDADSARSVRNVPTTDRTMGSVNLGTY